MLSNTLIIGGALLGYQGLERFVGRRGPQWPNYLLLALFPLLHADLTYLHPSLALRNLNLSVALGVITLQGAWLMLHRVEVALRPITRWVGVVMGLCALVCALRIGAFFFHPPTTNDYFHSGAWEAWVLVLLQAVFFLLTYALVLMVNQRLIQGIQTQEEKYSKAFQASSNGIALISAVTRQFLEVNESFARFSGYRPGEILGKTPVELNLWLDARERDALLADLAAQGTIQGRELRLRHQSGATVIGLASVDQIFFNQAPCLLVTFSDITERKQLELERADLEAQRGLLEKAESLRRMAGAVAHNFNNQLAAVQLNLELASSSLPPGSEVGPNLAEALHSVRNAATLGTLMLTYVGQSRGDQRPLDLAALCREHLPALQMARPAAVQLTAALPAPGPTIQADARQIQQILTNLVTNAGEACGAQPGQIQVAVSTVPAAAIPTIHRWPLDWQSQGATYACLTVSDNAQGIADALLKNLFDPFFSTKFTGRGLGLPVVLGTVRAYGGAVAVTSQPGQGTVVRVYLPLSTQPLPPPPVPPAAGSEPEWSGTVLLVEDDGAVRQSIKAALTRLGFRVLEAQDGVEAVEVFQINSAAVRCVICDLTMPRRGGWETLAALRQLAPGLPVILASGHDSEQVLAGHHAERPQVFLHKPYELKTLRDALRQVLGGR